MDSLFDVRKMETGQEWVGMKEEGHLQLETACLLRARERCFLREGTVTTRLRMAVAESKCQGHSATYFLGGKSDQLRRNRPAVEEPNLRNGVVTE
jgi:hypothetical protein